MVTNVIIIGKYFIRLLTAKSLIKLGTIYSKMTNSKRYFAELLQFVKGVIVDGSNLLTRLNFNGNS